MFQVKNKKNQTNHFSHCIVKHDQFFMQFCLTWKGWWKKLIWWFTGTARNKLKRIAPIIDTVILLGRLGLAFKGHRDDSQFHPNVCEYSTGGVGNVVEVFNYGVRCGDSVLEDHLRTCSKNASYISKTFQNVLINCCGNYIKDILVKEIKGNRFF